jgi:hypothetical protein
VGTGLNGSESIPVEGFCGSSVWMS